MKKCFLAVLGLLLAVASGAQPLNVRDFGAKGDGIADDTAGIQLALNKMNDLRKAAVALYLNGQGTIPSWGLWDGPNAEVFLPAGTYRITRPLVGITGITLTGEPGTVIEAEFSDAPILYLERAFTVAIRDITFRGGGNQIVYWTANQNAAFILIDRCTFEGSADYAFVSKSFGDISGSDNAAWETVKPIGPYKVEWDEDGMPTLIPLNPKYPWANSTLVVMRECEFVNCAGAYDGRSDGQSILNCTFVSDLPQTLPVWNVGGELAMENIAMTADIPENFSGGWIVYSGPSYLDLRQIQAKSSSQYGAPLLCYRKKPRSEAFNAGDNLVLTDCAASSADSRAGALIEFDGIEPMLLSVTRCREIDGRAIEMFLFRDPPQNDADLLRAHMTTKYFPDPDPNFSHAWSLADNGRDLAVHLPPVLVPFVTAGTAINDEEYFPTADPCIPPWNPEESTILRAADFGIGIEPAEGDFGKLEEMLKAAAETDRAILEVPGRLFELERTLTLPEHVALHARGRAFFSGRDQTVPLFRAEGGDLDLEFTNMTFNGGSEALEAVGGGQIRIDNCSVYENNGISITRSGEAPLRLEVNAAIFTVPMALTNHGGDVLLRDWWMQNHPTLPSGAFMRNLDGGTLTVVNMLGVPVVFLGNPGRKGWTAGKDLFWIENDGTLYSRFNRFGGESNGVPVLDNCGAGRALITGRSAYFANAYSCLAFFRNHDPDGCIIIHDISSFHEHPAVLKVTMGLGVRPGVLEVTGYLDPAQTVRDK